jgi:glycerophosphoryl diester phosphodiesterase
VHLDTPGTGRPLVIGHRGASGYRPEHTLESYALAARMGADCIEPDVVPTRDGVLVARHESEISGTTDIADRPELADRRTTRTVDGHTVTGWFTEDLTLAELRTLRAVERIPALRQPGSTLDGRFTVPTLAEILRLRAGLSHELGREIAVYIETKHPSHFAGLGLSLEEPLVEELTGAGLTGPGAPVFVQSFELGSLRRVRAALPGVPLVLLVAQADGPVALSDAALATVAREVEAIGPDKQLVIPWQEDERLGAPTDLVARAHAAGLLVHPWTFRAENHFLPRDLRLGRRPADHGHVLAELAAYLEAGVDGVFTDQPDLGVLARDASSRVHRRDT